MTQPAKRKGPASEFRKVAEGRSEVSDPWRAVHDRLREMILSGTIQPGSRLVETELAEMFGTSRGPVRSALKQLEHGGLVAQRPRRGSFVQEMSDEDIEDIFSLWEAIWPLAVRRALNRMTASDVDRLRALLPPPPGAGGLDRVIQASMSFYRTFFEIAAHGRLLDIWDTLTNQAQFRLVLATTAEKRRAFGVNPIAAIFAAIEERDADAAIRTCFEWTHRMRELAASTPPGSAIVSSQ